MKSSIFCNNCGKQGHVFHSCKLPIISNGIIVYRERNKKSKMISSKSFSESDSSSSSESDSSSDSNSDYDYNLLNNKYEYLMIRRKDTLGYVDFLRGRYSIYNKLYLLNIINEMTIQEKENIQTKNFEVLWNNLWCGASSCQFKNEGKISKDKFEKLKEGILINKKLVTLESLIKESDTSWTETEWGFPKGRRNYNEKDLVCAIREFEEETGYKNIDFDILYNIIPYEEIFTGSNFKSYKHKYFICKMKDNVNNNTSFQKSEVSEMEWKTYKECLDSIRPYNVEKKDIIMKINKVLNKYLVL